MNTLRNNGYPTSYIRHLNNRKTRTLHTHSNTCFLKLPHFSETITKEIRKAIHKEGLDIQLAHSGPSLRQHLTKKHKNVITACTLANCPIRDPNTCHKTYTIYRLTCSKCLNFYIGSTIRPLHIRIKEHIHTRASSFHKHLIKCKNRDNSFSVKIEAIIRNIGNLRIRESLLIAKLGPSINNRLELNTEYIFN